MPARFEMCACGKHGRIVLADGFRGHEACDKESALHLARTGVQFEQFSDADVPVVMQQILESALPGNAQDVPKLLLFSIEVLNYLGMEYREEIQRLTPEVICKSLFGALKEGDIPADFMEVIAKEIASRKLQ